MCGISGIINKDTKEKVGVAVIKKFNDAIAHRGPDGEGYWIRDNIALGHRRLAIIDIEGSKQPMSIEEESFTITYNGEIYNYKELRETLTQLGCRFRTEGDTEVILKSYEYWGVECLQKFRGMFAFAIVDKLKGEVFIARDHFGIKPLLYYTGTQNFVFGSEIQQFSKFSEFEKKVDVNAVASYMHYGYIPAPMTIFEDLYKLEPGSYLRVSFDGVIIEEKTFYDVSFEPDESLNYKEWLSRVDSAIQNSVNYHKRADVAYGTFLSGGIDSSLIASYIAEENSKVKAFTMGFFNQDFNEVPYAKTVAKKYNLEHHIEYVSMDDIQNILPKLIEHYGEPFSDSSAIPTYLISKKIREYLPVILSGDGGDEAFGGYYSYQNFLKKRAPHAPKEGYKNYVKRGLKYLGKEFKTMPKNPQLNDWIDVVARYSEKETKRFFIPEKARDLGGESVFEKWYQIARSKKLDIYSTVSYLDYKTYIHGDILTKVDIASMMNSLEVRTPLIDKEIIGLMAKIPSKFKITRNFDGSWNKKMILNSLASQKFGNEFVKRKKQGFAAPLQDWFHGKSELGNEFQQIISNKNSRIFQFFNEKEVQHYFQSKNKLDYNKLYQLFYLERWMKSNQI